MIERPVLKVLDETLLDFLKEVVERSSDLVEDEDFDRYPASRVLRNFDFDPESLAYLSERRRRSRLLEFGLIHKKMSVSPWAIPLLYIWSGVLTLLYSIKGFWYRVLFGQSSI